MKKTIMHRDYWVEIPAGECVIGLSDEQREHIWEQLLEHAGYHDRSPSEKALMDEAIEQCRQRKRPSDEQLAPFGERYRLAVHRSIISFARPQTVHLNRFYIARFPLTQSQAEEYRYYGTAAHNVSGALEAPQFIIHEKSTHPYFPRQAVAGGDLYLDLAHELGARIPAPYEWEKAARGTDGRFYPWGDEWNHDCGYFYYRQKHDWASFGYDEVIGYTGYAVDTFPKGQSPYGVWAMAGGLPEMVRSVERGTHPRYSSAESAYIDHLAGIRGGNPGPTTVSLRIVMDNWTVQQWTGVDLEKRGTK